MKISIVLPVYNDWSSFNKLLKELDTALARDKLEADIFAVDDGSTKPVAIASTQFQAISSVTVITAILNLGHQRAIAIGLTHVHNQPDSPSYTIVMDSDGEDNPSDIIRLIQASANNPEAIVVAKRGQRAEGKTFKLGYFAYKLLFRLSTGVRISFGNFMLLPKASIERLLGSQHTWNNFAASVKRSRLELTEVSTARSPRLDGKSHMSLVTLVTHGLSAISVYIDIVITRLLITCIVGGLLSLIGITVVLFIRFFTGYAIPGWATSALGALGLIFLQFMVLGSVALFTSLSSRSIVPVFPLLDAKKYIKTVKQVYP